MRLVDWMQRVTGLPATATDSRRFAPENICQFQFGETYTVHMRDGFVCDDRDLDTMLDILSSERAVSANRADGVGGFPVWVNLTYLYDSLIDISAKNFYPQVLVVSCGPSVHNVSTWRKRNLGYRGPTAPLIEYLRGMVTMYSLSGDWRHFAEFPETVDRHKGATWISLQ